MRTLRDAGRGRVRRPAALAATAVIAAMLIPAGAAVADTDGTGETTQTSQTTTSTEPVVVQPTDPQEGTGTDAGTAQQQSSTTTTSTTSTSNESSSSGSSGEEGGEGGEEGGEETVVIGDEDSGANEPVDIVPDDSSNNPGNGGGGGSSGQSGNEQLATMDLSFTFLGLTSDQGTHGDVATVGKRVRANPQGDYPSDAEIVISWSVGGVEVAEGPFYTPTADDLGKGISISWLATASGYDPHIGGQSVALTTVEGLKTMRGQVGVNGTYDDVAYVGSFLEAVPNAEWPVDAQFSWEWSVGGSTRSHTQFFWPSMLDAGQDLWLYVTVTAPGYEEYVTGVQVTSNIVYKPDMPLGAVGLVGQVDDQAQLGKKLTAQPSGWPSGAQLTYRWRVDGEDRATTVSYTPTVADLGKFITVTVSATHADFKPGERQAWGGTVVTTPTVAVGSSTVTVGDQATLPVTVAGPQGGPVPTGDVKVTLTPKAGGRSVDLGSVALDHGVATFSTSDLPVGVYAVKASYVAKPIQYSFVAAAITLAAPHEVNPYVSSTGAGTLTVVAAKTTVTAPATLGTTVATRASFDATVTVAGSAHAGSWTVREGTSVLAQGEVGKGGGFSVQLPVLSLGTHTLVLEVPATARTAAASTTVVVTVTGEPTRTGTTPTTGTVLETPKAATAPGQQMELVAEGFLPGETVAFYLHSEPMYLGTAVAGADGVARLLATIPAGAPVGTHTVIATGGTSGRWATLAVELATPAATPVAHPVAAPAVVPAATGDLAVTGSQSSTLMLGAWLLLLVGGGLVVVARRVRATR